MHIAFVDDSEQKNPQRSGLGHLLAYGAVVISEENLSKCEDMLCRLRKEVGAPEGTEFKWAPGKESFYYRKNQLLVSIRRRMFDIALEVGAKIVIIVSDLDALPWDEDDVKREMLRYLYERLSGYLSSCKSIGAIIADKPGGGSVEEKEWLAESLELTNNGTEYVTPDRITLPIVTADSKHVLQLQLADLVVSACRSAVSGSKYGMQYAQDVHKLAHKNAFGYAGGTGIKLCPDASYSPHRLNNLHYWVFSEDTDAKVSMNTGVRRTCRGP